MEEKITLFCRTGKEAAKLFGLFADHKGFLPKMGEVGSEVSVSNSSMTSTYKLLHSSSKIVAEVIFYKIKIKSSCNTKRAQGTNFHGNIVERL
jgi:hypothetical protein